MKLCKLGIHKYGSFVDTCVIDEPGRKNHWHKLYFATCKRCWKIKGWYMAPMPSLVIEDE